MLINERHKIIDDLFDINELILGIHRQLLKESPTSPEQKAELRILKRKIVVAQTNIESVMNRMDTYEVTDSYIL